VENIDVNKERKITDAFGPAMAMLDWGRDYFPADHRAMLVFNYGFLKASALGWREVRAAFGAFHDCSSAANAIQETQACTKIIKSTEAEARRCLDVLGVQSVNDEKLKELASALWRNFKQFYFEVPDMTVFWGIIALEAPAGLSKKLEGVAFSKASEIRASRLAEIQKLIAAAGSSEMYFTGCELQHLVSRAAWALAGFENCLSAGHFAKPPGHEWEIN
jgi:hypothetical protein